MLTMSLKMVNKLYKSLAIYGFILYIIYILLSYNPYFSSIFTKPIHDQDPNFSSSPTNISHFVFGIASSTRSWSIRKHYIDSWWRPNITRGYVFFEKNPNEFLPWPKSSPPFLISQNTSKYKDYDKHRTRDAIRIARIILEMFNMSNKGVRWYIMSDDDTVFFIDNLVDVLARYDHKKYFYIGMNSECHLSNYLFSFDMAFGGAGFAFSYPLAEALVKNFDLCVKRYPTLYGSDHILQSCVADTGVSLTKEKGFHQIDLHNDISGYLSAHPQSPLISLHHLDAVDPIFPSMNRTESLNNLMKAAKTDESRLLQQKICYHKPKNWTFSISWGYTVQVYESIIFPSILRQPLQTFTPWKKSAFVFNTRMVNDNPCEAPHVFFFDSVERKGGDYVVMTYRRGKERELPACSLSGNHSADSVSEIYVLSPSRIKHDVIGSKRECCDVLHVSPMKIKLRNCLENEIFP